MKQRREIIYGLIDIPWWRSSIHSWNHRLLSIYSVPGARPKTTSHKNPEPYLMEFPACRKADKSAGVGENVPSASIQKKHGVIGKIAEGITPHSWASEKSSWRPCLNQDSRMSSSFRVLTGTLTLFFVISIISAFENATMFQVLYQTTSSDLATDFRTHNGVWGQSHRKMFWAEYYAEEWRVTPPGGDLIERVESWKKSRNFLSAEWLRSWL